MDFLGEKTTPSGIVIAWFFAILASFCQKTPRPATHVAGRSC